MALCLTGAATLARGEPLKLHPENGHYFEFRGKPAVLVTSGEHYGAVLNRDFDYVKYLDTLAADGLNLTRTFSGCYVEDPSAFNIARNTLAPKPDRFLCPWARTGEPGDYKFDLTRWDEAYFARLKDFVSEASKRGVVVEMNLFCPMYGDSMWERSPMNARNNVNGVGNCGLEDVYFADRNDGLLPYQKAMAKKIVEALNEFDNVYFEITNEPYIHDKVPREFEDAIIEVVVETERALPNQHLISLNIANGKKKVVNPNPAVSIFNFHYASPPETVALNYGLDKVIGDNETGFRGTGNAHYRMEGWEFLLAGGGLYNNLDYSFVAGMEDGTFEYPEKQPGGGNATLRKQIGFLKRFIERFDFTRMRPMGGVQAFGETEDARATVLAEAGRQYAGYAIGEGLTRVVLADAPEGNYTVEWSDPVACKQTGNSEIQHGGGPLELTLPEGGGEVAFAVRRK